MENGLVFNIQRYSVHDGPGIRTTVFLKGCPLHCSWCHNPEGISSRPEIYFVESLCIGCFECRQVCPASKTKPLAPLPIRVEGCDFCGQCAVVCPVEARRVAGTRMSVREVVQAVLSDQLFFQESQGGVTFSGGEPLMQPQFLAACLEECRSNGLHTAVDTCGLAPTEDLLAVAPFVDLFLYDLKLMDEESHRHHTGASNRLIINNLRELGRVHGQIWVRVPFIPGVNDQECDLRSIAQLAKTIPAVQQVNLLPFHKVGRQKFLRVGLPEQSGRFEVPSGEAVARAVTIFQNCGTAVHIGG